ncbi:Ribonuclease P 40kDa (Rpp40) subunit [Popillia japonica]|uniref:Ribonuclease P 40kDa (Rpp40) subunit n=1 Tax=Popillia japonica TaxID=7064 RepID=A0AAW1LUG0_POPJA
MLCPEVWNFKAPESDFKIEKSSSPFDSCSKTINNFYFNHLVSLTVPDALNIPKALSNILIEDCDYYKVCKLDVSEFINATFINSFVKSGTLTLLSINTRIDCDNCLVITPSKKLILSLTKESYQASGLEGTVSHFCTNTKYKYNDATSPSSTDTGAIEFRSHRLSGDNPLPINFSCNQHLLRTPANASAQT